MVSLAMMKDPPPRCPFCRRQGRL